MSHFSKPIRFIDQFLGHFQPLFSDIQMNILCQMIYAMFFDYKRLSLSAIAKRTHLDYQKLLPKGAYSAILLQRIKLER